MIWLKLGVALAAVAAALAAWLIVAALMQDVL
jgi:hypothetical protein